MKQIIIPFVAIALASCSAPAVYNVAELTDNDLSTSYVAPKKANTLIFDGYTAPMKSYKIYASDQDFQHDPSGWVLSGSKDGKQWTELDRQKNYKFSSRFQEFSAAIKNPDAYTSYRLRFTASAESDRIAVGEVKFCEEDSNAEWNDFAYPEVNFKVVDPETEGARLYGKMVQDPDAYIRYHAREVAKLLFYSAKDSMNKVGKINYILKDYRGISAKSGNPANTTITFSTRHVENSAKQSFHKLDYETRGVLFHELVHAYQFEPKGIGSYGSNKEFWACVEGMADAVRAHAGYFDIKALRKPGGNWLDGYKTTGFFLEWLTEEDPDAIRKFNVTVRDLKKWSFDNAMKAMYGCSIQEKWDEYQEYLKKEAEQK